MHRGTRSQQNPLLISRVACIAQPVAAILFAGGFGPSHGCLSLIRNQRRESCDRAEITRFFRVFSLFGQPLRGAKWCIALSPSAPGPDPQTSTTGVGELHKGLASRSSNRHWPRVTGSHCGGFAFASLAHLRVGNEQLLACL